MVQKEDRRLNSIIGGKWRVDTLLGSGSMASVYGVTHRNGAKAALKILHPTLCTDPKVCERFLGEGYVTNQVKHSGIVRVLDDGMTDDGCVFLVMDLLEGMTLEALRQERGGRMDVEETLDIADALMDALHAVHAAGIIHRDLKPQNVFICENGDVKLLDFGVARVLETSKSRNKMSLFGMVLGTPSFMSPEQATGARDQVDHRADIYSLGATIFTILTGETVHLGPHVQAKLLAAGTTQARSISLVAQDLHPALANVIDTSLRFEKEDRWQSVDAFRRALKEARRAAGLGDAIPLSVRSPVSSRSFAPAKPRTLPPAKRSTKRPQAPAARGPIKTFAGIGALEAFPPPKVPEAKRTLPYFADAAEPSLLPEHPAGHTGAAAALPVGIVRGPSLDDSNDSNDGAKADGSYPAVGGSIRRGAEDADTGALINQLTPRRSGPFVWLASVGLVAAAIGLIAFFAMGTGTSSNAHEDTRDDTSPAAAPATLTSAAAPANPAPTSTGMVIGDPPAPAREARDAGVVAPPPARQSAITPPPTWHPPRSSSRNQTSPLPSFPSAPSTPTRSSDPQPVTNPASSAPAPAPTDPFSTPE